MSLARAVIACRSRDAYVVALGAILEGRVTGAVPVLGPLERAERLAADRNASLVVGESAAPSEELLERARASILRAVRAPPRTAGLVVALDAPYAPYAAALAALSGRPMVEASVEPFDELVALGAVAADDPASSEVLPRSITFVAHPDVFTAELLARLTGLSGETRVRAPFGILTARTEEAVSRVVARSLLLPELRASRNFSVLSSPVEERARDGHELVEWSTFGPAEAATLSTELFDVVALTSHGDCIDLHLSGVVLCGRAFEPGSDRVRPGQLEHTCMMHDCCPRTRGGAVPRLRVDRVRCRVLFAETCSGIALRDRVFPSSLSVGLSALDGSACAYLSTTKVARATGMGPVLATAMMSSGETLGDTARVVDVVHRHACGDAPSFLLVGDPAARFAPSYEVLEVQTTLADDGRAHVRASRPFRGVLARVSMVGAVAEALASRDEAELRVHVRRMVPEAAIGEVFAAVVARELGQPLVVVLASPRPFTLEELELDVLDAREMRRSVSRRLARIDRRLVQLEAIRARVAAYPEEQKTAAHRKCVADLAAVVTHGRALIERELSAFHGAQNRIARIPTRPPYEGVDTTLKRSVSSLDAFVANGVPSWGLHQYQVPLYGGILFAASKETPHGPCYRCGLPAFDLQLEADARPDLRRVITHCPACDLVFDRLDDEVGVEIHGASPVRRGEAVERELIVTNEHDAARVFATSIWIEGAFPWLDVTISPPMQALEVPASTRASFAFELSIGRDTAPGVYRLTAFTTSELSWSLSGEPLVVVR